MLKELEYKEKEIKRLSEELIKVDKLYRELISEKEFPKTVTTVCEDNIKKIETLIKAEVCNFKKYSQYYLAESQRIIASKLDGTIKEAMDELSI